jgi:hypothetical protein
MKRRKLERVERRRNLLELNLISETKPRLAIARRGCLATLVPAVLALALAFLAVYTPGLR